VDEQYFLKHVKFDKMQISPWLVQRVALQSKKAVLSQETTAWCRTLVQKACIVAPHPRGNAMNRNKLKTIGKHGKIVKNTLQAHQ